MIDEDIVVKLIVAGSKNAYQKAKFKLDSKPRFVRASAVNETAATDQSRTESSENDIKSCKLLSLVYDRARELAECQYPSTTGFTDQYKTLLRRCLEGHDLSKLPNDQFLNLIRDGIIPPDQLQAVTSGYLVRKQK